MLSLTLCARARNKILSLYQVKLREIHLRELLKGGVFALVYKILGMALGYVFVLIVSRQLGAGAVGQFMLSLTFLNVGSMIGKLGCDRALVRLVAQYKSQNSYNLIKYTYFRILYMCIPFALIVTGLCVLFAHPISAFLFKKEVFYRALQIMSLGILPMTIMFINAESVRGLKKIQLSSFIENLLSILLSTLLLVATSYFYVDVYIAIGCYSVGLWLACALSFWIWFGCSGILSVSSAKGMKTSALLGISLPMLLSSSMNVVMRWMDTIMLGMFKTEQEVGIFGVALKLADATSLVLFAVNAIAAPKFAELFGRGDLDGLRKAVSQATKLVFWASLPVFVLIGCFPSFLLSIFGPEFREGTFALLMLTSGQLISAISGSVGSLLQMTGRQKLYQNIIVFATVLKVVLNLILIPRYGINGAAFSGMFSVALINLVSVVYSKRSLMLSTLYVPFITKRFSRI